MTPNNWVATIGAVMAFLTALVNYLRQRRNDRMTQSVQFYTKRRFDDILVENRRLREKLVANDIPVEDTHDAGNS